MTLAVVLTTLVGIAIVAQGSVNAHLVKTSDLWLVLAIGNLFCTVASVAIHLGVRASGSYLAELKQVPPSVIIPSICGLVITAGMPLAIGRVGVFTSVILFIAVQIGAGLTWERYSSGAPIPPLRLVGAALVFGGGLLVMKA